jgi:signal peptidase I
MKKKKWLGSLLNLLVPGLGNVYGRNIKRGVFNYILFFLVVFSLRFVAYNFALFVVSLILILTVCLYLIVSAYLDVKKINVAEPTRFDKWYAYVLVLIVHGVLMNSINRRALDNLTPINFASIPTPAMEPSLLVGDVLAFKKTKVLERNDVTIFWFPDNKETMYVKRCIGMPGDSLKIENSTVLINGTPLTNVPLKFRYHILTDGAAISSRILERNQLNDDDYFQSSSDAYEFFLTEQQAKEFKTFSFLKSIDLAIAIQGEREPMIYPASKNLPWNADFYGAIYIPKKGDRIQLTEENIDLYFKCIQFENQLAERDHSGLKVNGKLITLYEFKENYFFMMGDNRHNSLDSRYWGLLPQELVIGKAMYLYWGQESDRIGKDVI